jgi:DNA-nicking Smr family endonuclease
MIERQKNLFPHSLQNNMVIELPVDGELDLHTFRPSDMGSLIPDYLEECRKKNILEVRIIHGKGTGALRRSTHAIPERLDCVQSCRLAGPERGAWGATLVVLRAAP